MSGRKSTEVNGLLDRGKDARNAGNANYSRNISTAEKILTVNQKKITEISSRIADQTLIISEVCQTEFPEETKLLEGQFNSLHEVNKPVNYEKDIAEARGARQRLDRELEEADHEGDRIRERIRNKNWYCDDEYRDADKLLKVYKRIGTEKSSLTVRLSQKAQESNKDLIQFQNLEKQISQVLFSYKQLAERANKIAELHKKASEAKDYIRGAVEKIDRKLAEKFLFGEFEELRQKCADFERLSEEEITRKVAGLSEQVGLFENRLTVCYEKFLEDKEKAELAIEGNKHLLKAENNFFYEPVDYAKNKESARKIGLIEYLSDFSDKKELIDKIQSGLNQAERYLEAEQFDEAERQAQENNDNVREAIEYATVLQEHLIENFYVARDIRGVMRKMGFEAGAFKIGGNVKNGWKISAKNPGGDTIDFTQIFIDDSGEVKIDIDHQTMGSCPSKWGDICKSLDNAGIHVERIDMVNGRNILNRREQKQDADIQGTEYLQTQPSR